VGFAHEGRSVLLTRALRRGARGDRHLSREYAELGAALGITPRAPLPALPVSAAGREAATRLLGLPPGMPYALLAPGATYGPAKRWPAARFAEAGRRMTAQGWKLFACGGAGEKEACDEVAVACGAVSLAGRTTLPVMAALCAEARAVVSNDSGMAHLAGAVGARTVAVFGSTSAAWTAPLGARVAVAQRPPVCAPCFARTCRIGYRCLEAVTVDDVLLGLGRADRADEGGAA